MGGQTNMDSRGVPKGLFFALGIFWGPAASKNQAQGKDQTTFGQFFIKVNKNGLNFHKIHFIIS